jgi:SWIM/SEC-C metal-binding protein
VTRLGSKKRPVTVRVESEERAHEIIAICRAHDWELIVGVEPEEPEDITDLLKLLQPERFTVRVEPTAGRNEQCPCGSGRKYKRCCLRAVAPASVGP